MRQLIVLDTIARTDLRQYYSSVVRQLISSNLGATKTGFLSSGAGTKEVLDKKPTGKTENGSDTTKARQQPRDTNNVNGKRAMAPEKKKTKDVGRGSGDRRSNSPTKAEGEREPRLLPARCGEDTLENNKDTGGLSGCSLGDSERVVTGSGVEMGCNSGLLGNNSIYCVNNAGGSSARLHGDLHDHDGLVKAIKKIDVVISTVGGMLLGDQAKLVAAIKKAGNVKVAVFNKEEDIGTYTIRAVDDPRTLNKILYIRPPANTLSFNELVSVWEKKIGKTLERIYVPEEKILQDIQELPFPANLMTALGHSVFVKGDHTNFEIEESFGVEASELYPDVKYTTVEEYLSHFA
ncbi:hypothetical protein SAY86_012752 [Trapa natans]|uniref:NmrA-like domain-containing protein n=1 Tax=Trapa natans TaxID=22666 RepID=A0AAN7LSN0_TRANT|nr:hypothetical protein SAY86_012752 [Trapa natans]